MRGSVLVLNELGYGNGVLALPFLDALANRVCSGTVWHVENPFLALVRSRFRLRDVPARWFRAHPEDHDDILELVEREGIELFVNLRNEDFALPFNSGYAPLRARLERRGVDVWDLFERPEETRGRYIVEQLEWLFAQHGVEVDRDVSRQVLESLAAASSASATHIGICLGASRADKRASLGVVRDVAQTLLDRGERVRIIGGVRDDEAAEAAQLRELFPNAGFVAPPSTPELLAVLRDLRAVVCNDTFAMHCAVALRVPTVALFSTTWRTVWGPPDSGTFRGIASGVCAACNWMPVQGYCGVSPRCAGVPNEAFAASDVADSLQRMLTSRPA